MGPSERYDAIFHRKWKQETSVKGKEIVQSVSIKFKTNFLGLWVNGSLNRLLIK